MERWLDHSRCLSKPHLQQPHAPDRRRRFSLAIRGRLLLSGPNQTLSGLPTAPGTTCELSSPLPGPHGQRFTNDRGLGEKSEIAAVQRLFRLPVHEEEFVRANDEASLPGR